MGTSKEELRINLALKIIQVRTLKRRRGGFRSYISIRYGFVFNNLLAPLKAKAMEAYIEEERKKIREMKTKQLIDLQLKIGTLITINGDHNVKYYYMMRYGFIFKYVREEFSNRKILVPRNRLIILDRGVDY